MKILGIEFGSRARMWYRTQSKETYLIVDTTCVEHYYSGISSLDVCKTYECDTEEEVQEYIENSVSKNDQKYIRIFKELPTPTNNK